MDKVVVIGAISSYSIQRFMQASKKLGLEALFIFHEKHIPQIEGLTIDNYIALKSLDINAIDGLISTLSPIKNKIESIVPGGELAVPITEAVCSEFGLPFNLGNSGRFRNKALMRETLSKGILVQPKIYGVVESDEELDRIKEDLQYPLIIKPVDGAASFFVKKIYQEEELTGLVEQIISHKSSSATGVNFLCQALLEQYVEGAEYSAEILVFNGEAVKYFITQKVLSDEPFFDEMGHVSLLEKDEPLGSKVLIEQVLKSMDVNNGVFHLEFKKDSDGTLYVIEVAARIAGDLISNIVEHTHSLSLEAFYIQVRSRNQLPDAAINKYEGDGFYTGVKFLFDKASIENSEISIVEKNFAQAYKAVKNVSPFNVLNRKGYEIFKSESLLKSLNYIG